MKKFLDILNLREGEDDKDKTLESVKKNISFKGANLWILACAILVASVGLNVNSTAVIIGAMLISPLMGPIVGAGFALGIYDFELLKRALRNLFNATVVSLTVSTIYFAVSPFKDVQSELLARTAPNIYDILIAFFGGIVGAIAVTRTEKGNPIPGVAIATALMPPLCTAGYGIATQQWTFFLGAFYLYCINCVFIGIATFLIIKYLQYPPKKMVNKTVQKRVRTAITILIFTMLVPSAYLAYSLYREQQFKKNINIFIEEQFTAKGYMVAYKKSAFSRSKKTLELAFLSKRFDRDEVKSLDSVLNTNKYLKGTDLIIRQDTTDRFTALKGDILKQVQSNENELNEKDIKIMQLERKIAGTFDDKKLLKEANAIFPQITAISVAKQELVNQKDSITPYTTVLYHAGRGLTTDERTRLNRWLSQRLDIQNIKVFDVGQ